MGVVGGGGGGDVTQTFAVSLNARLSDNCITPQTGLSVPHHKQV